MNGKQLTIVAIVLLLVILAGGTLLYQAGRKGAQNPTQSPTVTVGPSAALSPTSQTSPSMNPTNSTVTLCTPNNLSTATQLSPGAGNVYGTLSITNTSSTPCTIAGNNWPQLQYPLSVTNLKVSQVGSVGQPTYTLNPNQSVYAQIHYPNGPQCSSPVVTVDASLTYPISNSSHVSFITDKTNQTFSIPSCEKASEITTVRIWGLSTESTPRQ